MLDMLLDMLLGTADIFQLHASTALHSVIKVCLGQRAGKSQSHCTAAECVIVTLQRSVCSQDTILLISMCSDRRYGSIKRFCYEDIYYEYL